VIRCGDAARVGEVPADVQDARLGQVVGRVVRDADADDVAVLVRLPHRDQVHRRRVGRGEILQVGDQLGVGVVALVSGRELVGRRGGRDAVPLEGQ
jgi:hypothetical protein